jgi:hypothetical protein
MESNFGYNYYVKFCIYVLFGVTPNPFSTKKGDFARKQAETSPLCADSAKYDISGRNPQSFYFL